MAGFAGFRSSPTGLPSLLIFSACSASCFWSGWLSEAACISAKRGVGCLVEAALTLELAPSWQLPDRSLAVMTGDCLTVVWLSLTVVWLLLHLSSHLGRMRCIAMLLFVHTPPECRRNFFSRIDASMKGNCAARCVVWRRRGPLCTNTGAAEHTL